MLVLAALLLALFGLGSAANAQEAMMSSEAMARFVAVHGRLAWAGDHANTGLEVWAGALQTATNVQPEFRREGGVIFIPGPTILCKSLHDSFPFFPRVYWP